MATKNKKLSASEISKKFSKIPEWNLNTKQTEISRTFLFATFMYGFSFVAKVAVHAEVMGHHPDIELSYGKVKIKLTTHDVKGLTNADFELAKKIDGLKSN
ncbi:MAG: 4a-hydroxytetrahydrobiopterin dehydratase [Minisyncoccia bacterium]